MVSCAFLPLEVRALHCVLLLRVFYVVKNDKWNPPPRHSEVPPYIREKYLCDLNLVIHTVRCSGSVCDDSLSTSVLTSQDS